MISIPKNDYKVETEVRENVVQAICEAFLRDGAWSCFHPYENGIYRYPTTYVVKHKKCQTYYGFKSSIDYEFDDGIKIRGSEMKEAFKVLINHGYYMFRVRTYQVWLGYICSKKPYFNEGQRVTEFNDFID